MSYHGGDTGGWMVARERKRIKTRRTTEKLAQMAADGWSIAAASRELGISQQYGSRVWMGICAGLGWQAV